MMKKLLSVLGGLALYGAAALALAQSSSNAPITKPIAEPQAGFVKSVRGNVQLLSAAGTSRTASAGDALAAVDRIVTGPDSSASVVLRDDTTLMVGPSSRLDLKEFHFNSTTHEGGVLVSLLRGSMRMITGLIGKTNPDAIRVETQTATIGIRGTDFIVQADGQP
ncbi:hypothetical protein ASC78_17980 [Variovorax sp. Root318D1]|uniref:FecR family protein n=1 Tax=Variovorax sp. Root318D1 TaxID=1736513 RepID=UPI0006F5AB7A|nr:FecR domain-containing protein [Variovorax sp. Root318D1]KQU82465.1 hypothetical protein ASC78_17980 [Variovorax sp. Root318D1]